MVSIFLAMSAVMFGNMSGAFLATAEDTGVTKPSDVAIVAEAAQYTKAFTSIAEKFGLWAALTVLLVLATLIMGWLREKRMASRIDILEEARTKSAAEVATALTKNGELLENMVTIQGQQLQAMQCLATKLEIVIELKKRGE